MNKVKLNDGIIPNSSLLRLLSSKLEDIIVEYVFQNAAHNIKEF